MTDEDFGDLLAGGDALSDDELDLGMSDDDLASMMGAVESEVVPDEGGIDLTADLAGLTGGGGAGGGGGVMGEDFSLEGDSHAAHAPQAVPHSLDLLADVEMEVVIELGRTRRTLRDVLHLTPGSVVELDKQAGEPVDVLINDRPIARGEVVVFEESLGVRITGIITPEELAKKSGQK